MKKFQGILNPQDLIEAFPNLLLEYLFLEDYHTEKIELKKYRKGVFFKDTLKEVPKRFSNEFSSWRNYWNFLMNSLFLNLKKHLKVFLKELLIQLE